MSKTKNKDAYVLFKPYLSRLFTYLILLYLATNTYDLYKANLEAYKEFLESFRKPLLTDVKFVNIYDSCAANYTEIKPNIIKKQMQVVYVMD